MKKTIPLEAKTALKTFNNAFTIYSAGPIDLGPDKPGWRARLIEEFKKRSDDLPITMFDPSSAYSHAHWGVATSDLSHIGRATYIAKVNEAALLNSDLMVVSLPSGVQSVGTILEMQIARDAGVPIYLITDIPAGKSAYLDLLVDDDRRYGMNDLEFMALTERIVTDIIAGGARQTSGLIVSADNKAH